MKRMIKGSLLACVATTAIYAGGDIGEPIEPRVVIPQIVEEQPATDGQYNVALKVGTLGVGLDASKAINDQWAVRFNINGFKYSMDEEIDDVDYDADLNLLTAGILVDYFPFENDFRVSGGLYYNDNNFEGTAKPTATTTVDINGVAYGLADIGALNSDVTFNKAAPYLGIGWGNDSREKGWGFTFDLGVMYHGEPDVDLDVEVNPAVAGTPLEATIQANVDKEAEQFLDEVKDYKFYPVAMIGVNYTF